MAEDRKPFDACVVTFVQSKDLSEGLVNELSQSVVRHGGSVVAQKRDGSLSTDTVTHIISNTIDFPEYAEATAMMIPVVRSGWITASLARGKTAQIRPYSPDPRMFLSNVVLSCADIPSTDKEAIIGATMAMGGMESEHVTKLVTHVCALSMDHPKCQTALAMEPRRRCKIVLPHWFDDCFKLGKRIDEGPYLLPNPDILKANPSYDVAVPNDDHLIGATSTKPGYIPTPDPDRVDGGRPKPTVFNEKKVMLWRDLAISSRLKRILEDLIRSGGGIITESVADCDMLICHFREGDAYVEASHAGKHVGNLAWLYHLIVNNEWTSPMRRLLHYPVPKDPIPGFEDLMIVVSNYGGEARIYLENLIRATGAKYTKSMKAENTHLITARNSSDKCAAALDWNIQMINHLWIEESYAKCEIQSLTVPKYTHFPPRTNLGEVIGHTSFDESRLREKYYPDGPPKASPGTKRKRNVVKKVQDNAHSDGAAIPRKGRKAINVMQDDTDVLTEVDEAPTAVKRRATAEFQTPARGRAARVSFGTGKENETPSTASSTSRSAKDKALNRISDLGPDIALYEREKKRSLKGTGLWGGKRAAERIERENQQRKGLSSPSRASSDVEDEGDVLALRPAKKAKAAAKGPDMRVVLTGFSRWVGNKYKEDADRKKLRGLGIAVASDGKRCDYLVAPQLLRTVKFLRNLSMGSTVVSSAWIEQCLDTGKVPPPEDFILEDKENERKLGVNLKESFQRAAQTNGKLLWKIPIYCTAGIKNGFQSYKDIADANGAVCLAYSARSGTTIKPTPPEEDEGEPEPVYLVTTNTPEEKKLWGKFEDMARKGNMEPRVVAADWLLDVVLKQQMSFDERYLAREFFAHD